MQGHTPKDDGAIVSLAERVTARTLSGALAEAERVSADACSSLERPSM